MLAKRNEVCFELTRGVVGEAGAAAAAAAAHAFRDIISDDISQFESFGSARYCSIKQQQ
jgi:hypothetical protein